MQNGFSVELEEAGDAAVSRIVSEPPDLVVLDLMLPGLDGLSVCREVRQSYTGPILMFTAREDDMDQVAGLEMGADDYVKKPVEPRVLLARIRALLRRVSEKSTAPSEEKGAGAELSFGALTIVDARREVRFDGRVIPLSSAEYETLFALAQNHGRILSRDELSQLTKGRPYDGLDRSMDIVVSRLRKKLELDPEKPERIKTIWGCGYLFVSEAWNREGA